MNIMTKLTPDEMQALNEVSQALKVDPMWLYILIEMESGWNPQIKNPMSSARGLIQFMDATAKGMGYVDSADMIKKLPDRINQLKKAVYPYFKTFMPFNSLQSLFMACFYPKYRNVPPDTVFPNQVLLANRVKSPQEYILKALKKLKINPDSIKNLFSSQPISNSLIILALIPIILFILFK